MNNMNNEQNSFEMINHQQLSKAQHDTTGTLKERKPRHADTNMPSINTLKEATRLIKEDKK